MPFDPAPHASPAGAAPRRGALEVFFAFLKLGLTSFGGPIAHLGYFRSEFVHKRRWLDDDGYADLVALCQFLPGPASSQVGIAIGLGRAGWPGALAAWVGFTAPSAAALVAFALGMAQWPQWASSGAIRGLKVVAVAVVAQAVWGMARSLCTDRLRVAIAVAAALGVLALPAAPAQLGAIAFGGLAGLCLLQPGSAAPASGGDPGVGRATAAVLLALFAVLLVALPWAAAATASPGVAAIAAFYRAGALVFGGGHVVLPMLQTAVVAPGWVGPEAFLAGYGAAQAVPGPLFTFAAYLGAAMPAPLGGWAGGLALLLAVFLPGALLVAGALPFWRTLNRRDGARRAMGGIQAAVVGVLAAALYDPVWTGGVHSVADFALALACFALLVWARMPPVAVVAGAAVCGWALGA